MRPLFKKQIIQLAQNTLFVACFFMAITRSIAQEQFSVKETLNWTDSPSKDGAPHFKGAIDRNERHLPTFQTSFPVRDNGELRIEVAAINYEPFSNAFTAKYADEIAAEATIEAEVSTVRRRHTAFISVLPFRKNGRQIERVTSFELRIVSSAKSAQRNPPPPSVAVSALADGTVYKIAVRENGVHKLDYNFLKNALGISNLDNIDPRNIQVLGNGGGIVPEANSIAYPDDLQENAIQIEGENDGKFDATDYILFYAQGAYLWQYDNGTNSYRRQPNPYSDKNFYFIKLANTPGKRINSTPRPSLATAAQTVTTYNALRHYEKDKVNLLNEPDESGRGKGSGRDFFDGEYFKYTLNKTYDNFNFENLNTAQPVRVEARVAVKSIGALSYFTLKANGNPVFNTPPSATTGLALTTYANISTTSGQFTTNTGNIPVELVLVKGTSSVAGFLDYITMQAVCNLQYNNSYLAFRQSSTLTAASTQYQFNNDFTAPLWDVSDPANPILQEVVHQNNTASFTVLNDPTMPKEFVAHNSAYQTPEAVGTVARQNIHGLATPDMVIIYNPSVSKEAAERLAQHRRSFSNMTVEALNLFDVYNEFSSGKADIGAIRNMARLFYNRADGDKFKYLLLFGDASYDYRNLEGAGGNIVPTYESPNSMNDVSSYASDDFFGLLDTNEGGNIGTNQSGGLDIAIGRLPVTTTDTAAMMVDKIIRYDTNRDMLGDWINRATFAADDPDDGWNGHFQQANPIADSLTANIPRVNMEKNYLDAFQQISGAGGDRFPEATEAINNALFKGTLLFNYAGHGGPEGFAQERVLRTADLAKWSNNNAMPLCITASCSIGHYDDPNELSIGEKMLLKENGGMIALFTTIRPVDAGNNNTLNTNVIKSFTSANLNITMGEALQFGKNKVNTGANGRKFLMLGDPAQYLAHPEYNVVTTKINGQPANAQGEFADTLRSLQEVTIEGEIHDASNTDLTTFNGTIYPTVFDKKNTQFTLGNDANSPIVPFVVQKNGIFKGNAEVINGRFKFTFVVPKDINYQVGFGKISYYAKQNNSLLDASGFDNRIKIGGSGTGLTDKEPPVVKLFMNDEQFFNGGITNDKPILVAKLSDDLGINTAGAGIGHDITAVLDQNTSSPKVLNDFFKTEANSSKKGTVRYPLDNLTPGKHTLTVKCWDVANKSGESTLEFMVEKKEDMVLAHVLNYPNPFTSHTAFQFEHNKPGSAMTAQVQIFTVSGKLVKTIEQNVVSDGFRVGNIDWDATDDYGDRLANGVYVYRINVSYPSNTDTGTKTLQGDWQKLFLFK